MLFPPQGRSRMNQPSQGRSRINQPLGQRGMRQFPPMGGNNPNGSARGHNASGTGGIKGLLQKFVKPKNTRTGATGIANATTADGGGGFTKTLGNIQQVLNVAQSATPMIQQYGPMVKNLPTMISMLKALNESDDEEETDQSENADGLENEIQKEQSEEDVDESIELTNKSKIKESEENINKIDTDVKPKKKRIPKVSKKTGPSQPKLFI